MNRALVTGACGLVGYAACKRLLADGWAVTGVDNDSRAEFFGPEASTRGVGELLQSHPNYTHMPADIRSFPMLETFGFNGMDLVIHCASQPAHDWATTHIREDFSVNALGTLNVLEAWRACSPKAPFCHVSTSKVYGDNPNRLPLVEQTTRWELPPDTRQPYQCGDYNRTPGWSWHGIAEEFPVDNCLHSFFGVSKLSGDLLAQEYGRHFGLPVGIFRPGCVTGGMHRGVPLHGFLNYLARCVREGKTYQIIGHKGKQVRCNVHADDLVEAFLLYANKPTPGAVYNIGGRGLDCSVLEAIKALEFRCDRQAVTEYVDTPRTGDHVWYVSDTRKLQRELGWAPKRTLASIFDELAGAS